MPKLAYVAAFVALTGCAKHWEDVQPADIPASEYAHHDCDELDAALATAMRRSDAATMEQAELYGADIGLTASAVFAPWSLFFLGDEGNEIDLAEYKGQVLALQRARQARCF